MADVNVGYVNIKALAPKSMQEKESNMRLLIGYTIFCPSGHCLPLRDRILYSIHKLMIDPYNIMIVKYGSAEEIRCIFDDI